jgi:hypothetical protein
MQFSFEMQATLKKRVFSQPPHIVLNKKLAGDPTNSLVLFLWALLISCQVCDSVTLLLCVHYLQLKNSPINGNPESEVNWSLRNANQDSDTSTNASMSSQSSPIARVNSSRDPFLVNF